MNIETNDSIRASRAWRTRKTRGVERAWAGSGDRPRGPNAGTERGRRARTHRPGRRRWRRTRRPSGSSRWPRPRRPRGRRTRRARRARARGSRRGGATPRRRARTSRTGRREERDRTVPRRERLCGGARTPCFKPPAHPLTPHLVARGRCRVCNSSISREERTTTRHRLQKGTGAELGHRVETDGG